MNGDMPHVPITTLAGIASLTDLLNQLPLPSPLPATTAKSLLYNGRISEEVSSLLVCRDENLVTQLAHGLNQVSTEHIELKDNLGNDEPEGDMPVLLQTLLSRNPKIFRDKSVIQQPAVQQYKISPSQVHRSPAPNYQQSPVPQRTSGCFSSTQSGSRARFISQQQQHSNSPIPSPYTPQSPADYMQYSPPSYSQHQQTQQVGGNIRTLHNKVSAQLSSNASNHHAKSGSDDDYVNVAHRLGNEENEHSMMAALFPVKSPQSVCSPDESEEPSKWSRPLLIMQSPASDIPASAAPNMLLSSAERKKKQKQRSKTNSDHIEKNALYDIVSSPVKDSARLTLKLSRVKPAEKEQHGEPSPRTDVEQQAYLTNSKNTLPSVEHDMPLKFAEEEPPNCQQTVLQPNENAAISTAILLDDAEADSDALAEIERTEQESVSERERWSKEVQDKDKPLKKRRQDSYPQEPGVDPNEGLQGGNASSQLTPKKSNTATNGSSRPALMVSIDLQRAGRGSRQPVVVLETKQHCDEHSQRLDPETEVEKNNACQRPITTDKPPDDLGKSTSDIRCKEKNENQRKSKHRMDSGKWDGKVGDSPKLKQRIPESRNREEKTDNGHCQAEAPKSASKAERSQGFHNEDKAREKKRMKDQDMEKDIDQVLVEEKDRDREKIRDKNKIRQKDTGRNRDKERDRGKEGEEDEGKDRVKDKDKDREEKVQVRDRDKDRPRDKNHGKDRLKQKDRIRDKDRVREKGPDPERDHFKEKERDREQGRDKDRFKEKAQDKELDSEKDRLKDKEPDKERDRLKDKDPNKERDRLKEKEQHKELDREKERLKEKQRNKELDKEKDRFREPEMNKDRLKEKDRDKKDKIREKERNRERETDESKERVREDAVRKHKASKDNHNKRDLSPNRMPNKDKDSRIRQDGSRHSSDLSGHERTEKSHFPTLQNKKEKKGGDESKQPLVEKKNCEFPSYLLGGNSGMLKNFVIPKVKREVVDKAFPLTGNLVDVWKEPRVLLERRSLIENLSKGVKPVVMLRKLDIADIRSMKKELKEMNRCRKWDSTHRSSEASFNDKANKRRHSMISKTSKCIADSDEEEGGSDHCDNSDNSDNEATKKKRRKDPNKSWKGDSKKGRSRQQDWSSGESDSSLMPNSGDVAKKLKKKHKDRKAYEKMRTEDLMDSSAFKRFSATVDNILESLEDMDLTAADEDGDDEIPEELLLGKHQLSEIGSDSAKLKDMGIFHKVSSEKLVRFMNILEKNIQDSVKLSTLINHGNDSMDEERLWRDLILERVTKSADACLTALNIMTSPRVSKAVFIEDVIERVLQYTKYHLQNSLYPQYDPAYRVDSHGGGGHNSKGKKAKMSGHKQKTVLVLYGKVCDIISNLSELVEIQLLTDTTILQVSNLGITPFFVENVNELQLCAIALVTAVFSRYRKHRQLILEEIFNSLARLPSSKRNLRNFRLHGRSSEGSGKQIQMVTALVLQLIQCVVQLPSTKDGEDEHNKKVDKDVLITNSYETAMRTAQNFLSVFLKKCGSKQGEDDYRPLFENFVHDLLSTVNKPEWPAAELLLSLLGRLLVHQFSNKQTEMALRVASLDYLGTVASRLRKDAVDSNLDQKAIDRILKEYPGNDETQQLQKALLSYIEESSEINSSLVFARNFYIAQWYRDVTSEADKALKLHNDDEDDKLSYAARDLDSAEEIVQRAELRKKFLRKVLRNSHTRISSETVDYKDSCLIVQYLGSMRPFSQNFDIYLSQILRVLGESAIAVRTKAMKCLSEVVAVDPSILARPDMQRGVHGRLMDNSTSVREAAVELVGRFVLSRPELIEQYYDMLIERILDTGISVRKRVIKILRDICLELPDFHKITEMCVKMIRRVNDEEGIKKLVNETFQKIWFTPTSSHDKDAMIRKILNVTDVVLACKDSGYDWFEQLLQNLLKSEEAASYKPAKKACSQLVDNLVEHIVKYEESVPECEDKCASSDRLVACVTTLYLFSKIRPQLMVKHAMTMQPHLSAKCNNQNDVMVICNVAKILELIVPLIDNPSENFLTVIEEDLMKLILKYGMMVVQHCISCLGAVVNKVTHNYKFVWACFNRFYRALAKLKTQHQEDPNSDTLVTNKPTLLRSLFTVGALCRHFDFDQEEFKGASKLIIKEKILELLLYFTTHKDEEVQGKALIGLGFQFIMHPELMFVQDVKVLYNNTLSDDNILVSLKVQVLKNMQTYLQEEDSRMQEADREWKDKAKQEDLKEMGDISSGMSSSIIQIYLKHVLDSFLHAQSTVRHFALSVITLTLSQGLIHPVQCVPYLIAIGTDPEPTMKNKADQQLVEIDKKYSGFIHMKAVAGLKLSYQIQRAIAGSAQAILRGFRHQESDVALCAHLYTLVRGNRQHRRAFLISLLNMFDDSSKTEVNLLLFVADNLACFPYQTQEEPLFIMHHVDITLSVSGSNLLQSFKESLRKGPIPRPKKLKKKRKKKKKKKTKPRKMRDSSDDSGESSSQSSGSSSSSSSSSSEEEEVVENAHAHSESDMDDEATVMVRLPEDPKPLLDFSVASQGILLLLMLKQHLKNLFGFSDSKIQKYSPTESAKVYDKTVNRKSKVHFNPRQTLDFLKIGPSSTGISHETKKDIIKQYLHFKVLMEHLDREEEEEEGEDSAHARNKAITSLLRSSKPRNHNHNNHSAPVESEDEESDDDDPTLKSRRGDDDSEDPGHMNESVDVTDVVAICCPKYKDRPQIARVVHKTKSGYSVHWMSGSYSGPWAVAKKRDGRKKVPWLDNIKESDIIYKKISLTSGHKLTNKVAQTLRALYAAKDGTKH
ncbi:nipped-B-like protein B isoform X2 [Stigmatopora argus]